MKYIIFLLFVSLNPIFGQKIIFDNHNEAQKEKITYKVQVFSSKSINKDNFKHFIKTNRCEIEYVKINGEDLYRYLIIPNENNLISANKILDDVSKYYLNPFIVQYYKNKRNN